MRAWPTQSAEADGTRPSVVVITDANVLINLVHIGEIALLGDLPAFEFRLPLEVLAELTDEWQRHEVEKAMQAGHLGLQPLDAIDSLALFADLRSIMGRGEAACLAIAASIGCHLASDESRRFKRRAVELIGAERILRTEDLLLIAIRCRRLTVEQADAHKAVLASNRYVMPFESFAERSNAR